MLLVGGFKFTFLWSLKLFNCFVLKGTNPIYKQATSTFKNPIYSDTVDEPPDNESNAGVD